LGNFDYQRLHSVAPVSAALWFWAYIVAVVLVLLNVLVAIIMDHYLSVKANVGDTIPSIFYQLRQLMSDLRWMHSYEGSRKSVPIDELLVAISGDPSLSRHRSVLGFKMDRRPRTRKQILQLHTEPEVTVEFLLEHGCDLANAQRLLEKCRQLMVSETRESEPLDRLTVLVEVQMLRLRERALDMEACMREILGKLTADLDRIVLKQMKSTALARRIQKAQRLPDGWQLINDENGSYYYNERTGVSSWALPRAAPGGELAKSTKSQPPAPAMRPPRNSGMAALPPPPG
jgi:hypothetical protein